MNQIDKVLDSIDMVDDVTLEYSFNIVDSMFKAYEKSAIILENYEGDDLSSFTIFQEGEIMDDVKRQGKGQGTLMKILTAIPRLIIAVFRKLTGQLSKASKKASSINQKINDAPQEVKEIIETTFDNTKDKKRKSTRIKDILSNIKNKISQNKETAGKVAKGTVGVLATAGAVAGGVVVGKKAIASGKKAIGDIKEKSEAKKELKQKRNNEDTDTNDEKFYNDIDKFYEKYDTLAYNEIFKKHYMNIITTWNASKFPDKEAVSEKDINELEKFVIFTRDEDHGGEMLLEINKRFLLMPDSVVTWLNNFSRGKYRKYEDIMEALDSGENIFDDIRSKSGAGKSNWDWTQKLMSDCVRDLYYTLFREGLKDSRLTDEQKLKVHPEFRRLILNPKDASRLNTQFETNCTAVERDLKQISEKANELMGKINASTEISDDSRKNMQTNCAEFANFLRGALNVLKAVAEFQSSAFSFVDKALDELIGIFKAHKQPHITISGEIVTPDYFK